MHVDFCSFTDTGGHLVMVNPAHVRCIRSTNNPRETLIIFDEAHTIKVSCSPQEAEEALSSEEAIKPG